MLHDLGSKTAETENVGGPTIDLDEGMAAPGDDDDNSNEESKLSPVLEALIKQGGTEGKSQSFNFLYSILKFLHVLCCPVV